MTAPAHDPRAFLRSLFDAAVAAAQPEEALPRHLPAPPRGRTVVVGAGKAAAAMARAVEAHWPAPLEGLVVTRYGQKLPTRFIEVAESSHPVPDAAGEAAARRMLERVRGLGPRADNVQPVERWAENVFREPAIPRGMNRKNSGDVGGEEVM